MVTDRLLDPPYSVNDGIDLLIRALGVKDCTVLVVSNGKTSAFVNTGGLKIYFDTHTPACLRSVRCRKDIQENFPKRKFQEFILYQYSAPTMTSSNLDAL